MAYTSSLVEECQNPVLDNLIREPLLLMVPTEHDQDGQSRSLYSLSENKIYKNLKVALPHNRYCCGSSYGWLATVSENYDVSLVNPFLPPSAEIQLPPLTAFRREQTNDPIHGQTFLRKVVLSADPNSNPNYVVMAIHGVLRRISFFKPGDKTWTLLEAELIADVIYDQNKFYALIGEGGNVLVYDANDPSSTKPETIRAEREETMFLGECTYYLVKSSTDLLQIVRHVQDNEEDLEEEELEDDEYFINNYNYHTDNFKILKLDPSSLQWNSVDSLDGKVLLVGDNSSLCLSVSDMPGCKPNCIYATDDNHSNHLQPRDVGVYCLEDESFQSFYPTDSKTFAVAPIFIQPTAKPI